MDRRYRPLILILPFFGFFFFFLVGPFILLGITSVSHRTELGETVSDLDWTAYRTLFDPLYMKMISLTLVMALANAVLSLLLAYPMAFFISRQPASRKLWILTLVLVPFWTSFLVRILTFMDFLRVKPFGLDLLYTGAGVLGAMVYNYLPIAILPLYAAMEKIDNSVLEAARDLSASPWNLFSKIVYPLTHSAVLSSFLFVFVPSLGEFLIPDLVGGGQFFLMGSFLQNQFLTARNWPLGSAAIVLIVAATAVISLIFLMIRPRDEALA